jgi:hypothetical protein
MKMAVFYIVAPCGVVQVYRRFYQTARRNTPKDSHLQSLLSSVLQSFISLLLILEKPCLIFGEMYPT